MEDLRVATVPPPIRPYLDIHAEISGVQRYLLTRQTLTNERQTADSPKSAERIDAFQLSRARLRNRKDSTSFSSDCHSPTVNPKNDEKKKKHNLSRFTTGRPELIVLSFAVKMSC